MGDLVIFLLKCVAQFLAAWAILMGALWLIDWALGE